MSYYVRVSNCPTLTLSQVPNWQPQSLQSNYSSVNGRPRDSQNKMALSKRPGSLKMKNLSGVCRKNLILEIKDTFSSRARVAGVHRGNEPNWWLPTLYEICPKIWTQCSGKALFNITWFCGNRWGGRQMMSREAISEERGQEWEGRQTVRREAKGGGGK